MFEKMKEKVNVEKVKKNAKNVGLFVGGYVSAVVLRNLLGKGECEGEFVDDGDYELEDEFVETDEEPEVE